MVSNIVVRHVDPRTGEILFSHQFDDFCSNVPEKRELLYRMIDAFLNRFDSLNGSVYFEIFANEYPKQLEIF